MSVALRHLPKPLLHRLVLLFRQSFEPALRKRLDGQKEPTDRWNPSLFSFAVSYAILERAPIS